MSSGQRGRSFICICSYSPSLTLLPERHLYHISDHPETITPTLCSWKNLSSVNVVLDCQMGWEPLVYRGVSSLMIITYTHTHTHTHKPPRRQISANIQAITECWWGFFCIYLYVCPHACAQSCLTLCNAVNCSLPGFSVRGIL